MVDEEHIQVATLEMERRDAYFGNVYQVYGLNMPD